MIKGLFTGIFLSATYFGAFTYAYAINNYLLDYDKLDCSLMLHSGEIEKCKSADRIEELENKYTVVRENIKSDSTEGGVIEKYKSGKNVVIVKVIYYGEMGKRIIKYYFDSKNQPVFSLDSTVNYDRPMYVSGKEVESIEKYQFKYNGSRFVFSAENKNSETKIYKEKLAFVNNVFKKLELK